MIRLLILLLLISTTATAQSWPCGWSLSGDTLRFNDCGGKTVQINKTGLFTKYADTAAMLAAYQAAINGKQSTLVSATNIKTINGVSVLGSGNLVVSGEGGISQGTLDDSTDALRATINGKQPAGSYLVAADIAGKLNTDGNGSSLTGLTKSQVGLSNADNTSDANKPVSTAQSTAIAARGYTIDVQTLTSSPTDAQTIYFGQLPKAPVTAAATSKVYIRKAGTIKMANIYCYSGTAGTAEAWVMSIRLNNTTDTQIASVAAAASERVFTNSSLNIAVAAGDYIEIKCVNPTWATNPLTTIFGGYIYIE